MNSFQNDLYRNEILEGIMQTNIEPQVEPGWSRAGMKLDLVSCKHRFKLLAVRVLFRGFSKEETIRNDGEQ